MPQFAFKIIQQLFCHLLSLHTKLYTNIRYWLEYQKYLEDILRKYFDCFFYSDNKKAAN